MDSSAVRSSCASLLALLRGNGFFLGVTLVLTAGWLGCATGESQRGRAEHYFRYIGFELPLNENVSLRWQKRQMPLRVYLPKLPAGFVSDPEAVYDSVLDGIKDWENVAGPGIPRFVFVEELGDADIPIVWDRRVLKGAWFIAYAKYDINWAAKRFGVAEVLVTARRSDGQQASLAELYQTVLHEMGHALGLGGHSPEPGDIMYRSIGTAEGLSPRDRETLRLLYQRSSGHRVTGARSAD